MMKGNLFCLVLGCLLAASSSQFLYTTDERYPAHIVNDARVKCPEVGSYPHPADCSWFYRCVDRIKVGFYHVYFFECEPGTVFLDALDQCVYGSKERCSPVTRPPRPSPPRPKPTPIIPSSSTTTPRPIETTPSPPPPPPQPTNPPIITTTYPEIPQTDPPVTTVTVPSPPTPTPTVPETTLTPTEPTSTSTPQPPAPPPAPPTTAAPDNTESRTACTNCVTKLICKIGRVPRPQKVCESCRFGVGEDYIGADEECGHKSNPYFTDEGRCISGDDFCPDLRQEDEEKQSNQVQDQELYLVQCSDFKIRPDDSKIQDLFCKHYHYCSPLGDYQRTQRLCSNFFQCYKNRYGQWTVGVQNCHGPNLYSYDLDQCMPQPKASELC